MTVKTASPNARPAVIFLFCLLVSPILAHAAVEDHITRTETGFYYTIQKGDTLWDLSRKFSNSPYIWPDLWSKNNPGILNPHRIFPGQKIMIYKKGWEGRGKAPAAPRPLPQPVAAAPSPDHQKFPNLERVGFIRPTAVPHLGKIFKSKDDATLINKGAMVYVHPEPGAPALTVGGLYTTFRTLSPVPDPDTKEDMGVQHLLTGVLEITNVEPEFAIGTIAEAYRDILIDDRLTPFVPQSDDAIARATRYSPSARIINPSGVPPGIFTVTPGVEGLKAKILKPEEDFVLIGQNSIVFIDKGSLHGVSPGQVYSIFQLENARPDPDDSREVALTPLHIGELMILRTEPDTAAAVVTNSKQNIVAGNRVMTGEMMGCR